jgi:ABC-type sugar transport system ATPase subunit
MYDDGMRPAANDLGHTPPVPVLSLAGVFKSFAGVQALKNVDFNLLGGEVHALLGENGAGKSTLMRVLFGVWQPDSGEITLDGSGPLTISSPRHALALGIALVSQEPSVVPQLDVAQNIFLGNRRALSYSNRPKARDAARRILDSLAPTLSESVKVGSLGMAERQMVEIARSLARGGRIIAFDEPTSSLTPTEQDNLFEIIRGLKKSGKAIIYISHRMNEIHAIADRITVLRDGGVVASGPITGFSPGELNNLIAGRELAGEMERRPDRLDSSGSEEALRIEQLATAKLQAIDLTLHRGEILGLAGLVGSGRTELVRAIFGADSATGGNIFIERKPADIRSPQDAIKAGIALIPEDRRGQSLVPQMTVEQNFGLGNHKIFSRRGILRGGYRRTEIERYIGELGIRPRRPDAQMRNLSGGNQQKVVIARWLRSGARIFLFDEPTRGIDVGAKAEIHELLRTLAAGGAAVLVISSEMPELLTLAHRIGIMRDGRLVKTVPNGPGLTEEVLMKLASGEKT